jgi:hypothetical protein
MYVADSILEQSISWFVDFAWALLTWLDTNGLTLIRSSGIGWGRLLPKPHPSDEVPHIRVWARLSEKASLLWRGNGRVVDIFCHRWPRDQCSLGCAIHINPICKLGMVTCLFTVIIVSYQDHVPIFSGHMFLYLINTDRRQRSAGPVGSLLIFR